MITDNNDKGNAKKAAAAIMQIVIITISINSINATAYQCGKIFMGLG